MVKRFFFFVLSFVLVVCLVYAIHQLLFQCMSVDTQIFTYSLEELYLGFSAISLVVLLVLLLISKRDMHLVGMTFMLLTTFKMIGCYALANFVLYKSKEITPEKWNFFALFMVFLVLETVFTIKILNPKKKPS